MDLRILCEILKEIECLDRKLSEKSTYFFINSRILLFHITISVYLKIQKNFLMDVAYCNL